jgi:hypothetical protein
MRASWELTGHLYAANTCPLFEKAGGDMAGRLRMCAPKGDLTSELHRLCLEAIIAESGEGAHPVGARKIGVREDPDEIARQDGSDTTSCGLRKLRADQLRRGWR